MQPTAARRDDFTFRANLRETRYGWLRLTPAYSVHLVRELLEGTPRDDGPVLDPFCGTGTTALVCAELGIPAETTDINPFLLWLTRAKTRPYAEDSIGRFTAAAARVARAAASPRAPTPFVPPLHQIEKWWAPGVLGALGRGFGALSTLARELPEDAVDLLKIAFCQTLIACAKVSFGHQSMSFKRSDDGVEPSFDAAWSRATLSLADGARSSIAAVPKAVHCDARELDRGLEAERYAAVITSPPYPNRMSYIRELRPYMYWLGYLDEGREAGELDWRAIGGTWGAATSRVAKWRLPDDVVIPHAPFLDITRRIATKSPVLARYVEKYFYDMQLHVRSLFPTLRGGARVHYIVGNSKFYDVLLPVETILEGVLASAGFADVESRVIRKRTSKKELFEFVVSARKPEHAPLPRRDGT